MINNKSLRKQDVNIEKQLSEFMDSFFYSKLSNKYNAICSFERIMDEEIQKQGIDVKLNYNGYEMLIDEKASFYYSNVMIPTFAFELDSIQNSCLREGWFINDDLKTDYYFIIWPNVKCEKKNRIWIRKEIKDIKKDDFTIIEALLLKKSKLRDYLESKNYSKENLIIIKNKFRKENLNSNEMVSDKLEDGIKLVYSGGLFEKPINLVINKNILKNLSERIYLISEDGFANIKEV